MAGEVRDQGIVSSERMRLLQVHLKFSRVEEYLANLVQQVVIEAGLPSLECVLGSDGRLVHVS